MADVSFDDCVEKLRAGVLTAPEAAECLIDQLADDELLWLLDGDVPLRALPRLASMMKAGPIRRMATLIFNPA